MAALGVLGARCVMFPEHDVIGVHVDTAPSAPACRQTWGGELRCCCNCVWRHAPPSLRQHTRRLVLNLNPLMLLLQLWFILAGAPAYQAILCSAHLRRPRAAVKAVIHVAPTREALLRLLRHRAASHPKPKGLVAGKQVHWLARL